LLFQPREDSLDTYVLEDTEELMPQGAEKKESRFPATRWSFVRDAVLTSEEDAFQALDYLVTTYRPVLVRYLMEAKGWVKDRAEDLVHGFVAGKVIQGQLLRHADQAKGKFRNFLLTALNRYVIDEIRRGRAQVRSPGDGAQVDIDEWADVIADPAASAPSFDVEWSRQLIQRCLDTVQQECRDKGQPAIWTIFEARVLAPTVSGETPTSFEELVRITDLPSVTSVRNALITGKRKFQRVLRSLVLEYVDGEGEVDDEIRELIRGCRFNEARGTEG
jgi:RNA polymerase sigma-70 factor (ECF subfamily)